MLNFLADERIGAGIESVEGVERAVAILEQRHRRVERVLVVEVTAVNAHFAFREFVREIGGDLPAEIASEAGVTQPVAVTIEATDHVGGAIVDRALRDEIAAILALRAVGRTQAEVRRRRSLLENEVGGGAGLAIREDRARPAAQHLDALDGIVDAENRAVFEERKR